VYAPFKDNTAPLAKITGLQRLVLRSHLHDSPSSRLDCQRAAAADCAAPAAALDGARGGL